MLYPIFNYLYKSLPNFPGIVLRLNLINIKINLNYDFDARLLKEIIRERLFLHSYKWDYKTTRNYCSILGEGNLTKAVLCEHLSSCLVNKFVNVLNYALNNPTEFQNYTTFHLKNIWMPRFLVKIFKLAICPILKPRIRVSDLIHCEIELSNPVVFKNFKYSISDFYKENFVKPTIDGTYPIVTKDIFEESLVWISQLSSTVFKNCSIEISNYDELINYDASNFLTLFNNGPIRLWVDNFFIFSNDRLTPENLFTNIILGSYTTTEVCNVLLNGSTVNVVRIPFDSRTILEELRAYIENEFVENLSSESVEPKIESVSSETDTDNLTNTTVVDSRKIGKVKGKSSKRKSK